MKTIQQQIEDEIAQYNDGDMIAYERIRQLLKNTTIIESQTEFDHYQIDGTDYEIHWLQDHRGYVSATFAVYDGPEA